VDRRVAPSLLLGLIKGSAPALLLSRSRSSLDLADARAIHGGAVTFRGGLPHDTKLAQL
jgi:hypothetical protein